MIHLLGTAPFDGYNITPTYNLPDGKNRLLLFLAAGTSATDTRDATYNGSTMTVVKELNTPESYGRGPCTVSSCQRLASRTRD